MITLFACIVLLTNTPWKIGLPEIGADAAPSSGANRDIQMNAIGAVSDEDAGQQIMRVFSQNGIRPGGRLRRNNFQEVRDAHFQRGLDNAIGHA